MERAVTREGSAKAKPADGNGDSGNFPAGWWFPPGEIVRYHPARTPLNRWRKFMSHVTTFDWRRAVAPALAVLFAACLLLPAPGSAQRFVSTDDPEHPRVKYPDSLVSVNDRCAVRKVKLGNRVRPVYVNGLPIGFC
jgi:hypothetical protein